MSDPTPHLLLDPDIIARSIGKLPSLPAIVLDLLQSMEDDSVSSELLAAKISGDQALVARLLRLANSSFYGLQRKVVSIPDAMFVLGLSSVRNLALTAALSDTLGQRSKEGAFDFTAYWRHSVGVALCARALATKFRCSRENAFAAGLIHDIGQLVLSTCFPQHMAAVSDYQKRYDCQTNEAEWAVLGTDHGRLGEALTMSWGFPPALSDAVGGHHDPERLDASSLASLVHLADAITHALDLAGREAELVPRIYPPCWNAAGLSWAESQAIFSEVEQGFNALCDMLSLT